MLSGWWKAVVLVLAALTVWAAGPAVQAGAGGPLLVGGGPPGGTFMPLAEAIASTGQRLQPSLVLSARPSGGSADNVRRLDRGEFAFALAYAADIYLAAKGLLPGDPKVYDAVRPLGFLYGAPAQLVVPAESPVRSALDLAGKTVAVGNAGSGAALSAERFFRHLGLWGKFHAVHKGYSAAARAMLKGEIDAFWVLVGYPASAVSMVARQRPIRLVEVGRDAQRSYFYRDYPFYSPITIPPGVYPGVDAPCRTFQDSTLLCAHQGLGQATVYRLMEALWSPQGLQALHRAHPAVAGMSLRSAYLGTPVPLALGAYLFWRDKGFVIPQMLRPKNAP